MPHIAAYRRLWEKHPTADMLIAAYLGYKPPEQGDLGELIDMFQGGTLR